MKRHGQIMAQIADAENLRLAYWKASKGKRGKADCLAFRERLEENLAALRAELLAGGVSVGDYHYEDGEWSELVLQQRMQALLAFVMPAASGAFRRHVLQRFGVVAKRLEPCESGRQLEQQRDQLPDGESQQQQQPDEQQQQHRVPPRPAPSSTRALEHAPADPAAILSPVVSSLGQIENSEPPGASRTAENSGRLGARNGARTFLSATVRGMERGHFCPQPCAAWSADILVRNRAHVGVGIGQECPRSFA